MRDPNTYRCGCPKVEGERQCRPCHNAQARARRRGQPVTPTRPRITETQFTCGHPRIPVNTIAGGTGFPKGRCRYCRSGILTFDRTTGDPLPGALVPAKSPRGVPLPDAQVAEVLRRIADGEQKTAIVAETGISKTSVYRIARGTRKASNRPVRRHLRFELVSVRPLPSQWENQAGRSYSMAPSRRTA